MSFLPATPLLQLAADLDAGRSTSRALVETALERIAAEGGNGGHAFICVDAERARREADAQDALRGAGVTLSPLAGLPLSIKDLFDVAGERTRAGSRVLDDAPPAAADAPAVARVRRAGAVPLGRTNMSEFAFSGLGLNPWRGTPRSPWRDAATGEACVAGGSSSGAAASVAGGMAAAGLGSDTGGSLRIPAAFCGLTGFKPTAHRVPTRGMFPLSTTLDSTGAIAPTVACCALVDRVLAGLPVDGDAARVRPAAPKGLRLAVLSNYVTEGMDAHVARAWDDALARLSRAGVQLTPLRLPLLERLPAINRFGFSPIEAYATHRGRLDALASRYDPRVLARIRVGETANAADYIDLLAARAAAIEEARAALDGFDAFLMPTVPIAPPAIAALEADPAHFAATNALVLRNPSVVNFLDGCAVSLPCARRGAAPVGLSVAGLAESDAHVLSVAAAIEGVLQRAFEGASAG
ncbi:amidase [Paraburkholderia unamae]|uniref:Aspartyl-tRNA(Asn)/glutamyl-tRNA(Gln) amidotransferase subunit A n=1 Tax=Paraburkholderia unamae TaxID=219649 RepID=A0ABX5KSN6_9BURK|nr:amidase [Paraburkholderia unamae]PVX85077.1 aspartyl-tRNA(Asn)/glutamyl-tRNA(Gln) amidotransferase subunit A [Paraburkholderia unamae]